MDRVAVGDRRIVASQLGREPRGIWRVETRCRHGAPQVVSVDPVMEGHPFPTLFWLTCPHLRYLVSELEGAGWIEALEQRIADDEAFRELVRRAHAEYVNERSARLGACSAGSLSPRERASLERRGIGGTADARRVKCLHLHVAHALARSNPIGEAVLQILTHRECATKKGICSAT
ncbi:MAG: DUF501 domain-containing protein [Candidatus Bipolaricaulota bacterium]